jgi:hypothetical protein
MAFQACNDGFDMHLHTSLQANWTSRRSAAM